MTDTKSKDTDNTARSSKLQLGKKIEGAGLGGAGLGGAGVRVRAGAQGGRSVKVEVRKTRSITRPEAGAGDEPRGDGNVAAQEDLASLKKREADEFFTADTGDDDHHLTRGEQAARRRALLESATEGEEDSQVYLRRKGPVRKILTPEEMAIQEAAAAGIPATPAVLEDDTSAEEKAAIKARVKKKGESRPEEEEPSEHLKKRRRAKADEVEEIGDVKGFALTRLEEEQEIMREVVAPIADIPVGDDIVVVIADDAEVEDYSEDVEQYDAYGVLIPRRSTTPAPSVVRPLKGSERVVIAAVDPNRLKKNQRSEARSPQVRSRLENTGTNAMQSAAEKAREAKERREQKKRRQNGQMSGTPSSMQERIVREIVIPEEIVISDLANRMAVRGVDVIKELMKMGTMASQGDTIDADTAELVVTALGHTPKRVTEDDIEQTLVTAATTAADAPELLKPRAPVVTVMGHVDHGKTSLLDALRSTDVAAGEAGGITQHIGAYQVQLKGGEKITFLDTPGHEAFTAMRKRGANLTDIVVLVVAADDGIMEQTKEAINHAKAANVRIIVAVNKIDKPGANPARVKNELMAYDLLPEEFGGDTIVVEVSALQKTNLDKLEEAILVQAEVMELKANPDCKAAGMVVESRMEKGRGAVATLLVQKGTLQTGDIVVAGASFGRIRALTDDRGRALKDAGPSMPVEVLGLDEVPTAGEPFSVVESDRIAREVTEHRKQKQMIRRTGGRPVATLEGFLAAHASQKVKELPLIVKADVQGSAEAIVNSLEKIEHPEVKVRVLHSAVGAISESDVNFAETSGAIIIGFNVRATKQAKQLAEAEGVDIRYYSIIYELVDEVKAALSGLLAPEFKENRIGYAEIRQIFNMSKYGKVGGCMVTEGIVKRGAKVRLLRDNVVIHEGTLKTLRRFKDDVKEVRENTECGMAFENYEDIREGDVIECFELEAVVRKV
ncbi:MAG: translation initiation factor IF-2 [Alphaproteobacteria bacterium]|nr:translation initiation factor IF-2 [Alphaproteobacteria bacterium]